MLISVVTERQQRVYRESAFPCEKTLTRSACPHRVLVPKKWLAVRIRFLDYDSVDERNSEFLKHVRSTFSGSAPS